MLRRNVRLNLFLKKVNLSKQTSTIFVCLKKIALIFIGHLVVYGTRSFQRMKTREDFAPYGNDFLFINEF